MADLNLLTVEDKKALDEGRYQDISNEGIQYLTGDYSTGEILQTQAGRAFGSTARGLIGMLPENDFLSINKPLDLQQELVSRQMYDVAPATSFLGTAAGSVADPFFVPAGALAPLPGMVAKGAAAGAIGGAIEPVYPEFGDSRALNVAAGTVLGGALGGVGKLFTRKPQEGIQAGEAAAAKMDIEEAASPEVTAKVLQEEHPDVSVASPVITKEGKVETPNLRWNEAAQRVDEVVVTQPKIDFTLPPALEKGKPKFLQQDMSFESGLDKAFYVVGGKGKSAAHDSYLTWLTKVTGKSEKEVTALAQKARKEIVDNAKLATAEGNLITQPITKTASDLQATLSKPRVSFKPYEPPAGAVRATSVLDETELALLKQLGFEPAGTGFKNTKTKKFASAADVNARLDALGIPSGTVLKPPRATKAAPQAAEAAPMPQQTAKELGIPQQGVSMGSAGVAPHRIYGEDLSPKVDQKLLETFLTDPGAVQGRRIGMAEFGEDNPAMQLYLDKLHNVFYPSLAKDAKKSGSLRNIERRGQTTRAKILNEFNNLVEFAVANPNRALTAEETAAVRPLVEMARTERNNILETLIEKRLSGKKFDSEDIPELMSQLMYYNGIDMWYKGTGVLASRALNSRRTLAANIKAGKPITALFPGINC